MNYVVVTVLVLFVVFLLLEAWAMMENSKRRDQDARRAWHEYVEQELSDEL